MPANVETMMYTREKPWHDTGVMVQEAPTSHEALRLAGLDWTVDSRPVYDELIREIPGYKANVRSSDNKTLGIVTDRYKIVQNTDAFEFTDNLIGGDVHYETAGSLQGGKRIWLLAKLPSKIIVGDEVEPYLCFTNSHDGTGAIRACMTPVRVVCNNTLNLALATAKRQWSTKHVGDIEAKMAEARSVLEFSEEYMAAMNLHAEKLAATKVSTADMQEVLNEMFPTKEDDSECKKRNAAKAKEEIMVCYYAPDLENFRGTAWGAVNAISDFATHNQPRRNTENYRENNWGRVIDGHPVIDAFCDILYDKVGIKA